MADDERHEHTVTELRRVAEVHLRYEVSALIVMSTAGRLPPSDEITDTAVFESFMVHARLLNEFLTKPAPNRRFPQVVIALHYLPGWPCEKVLTDEERTTADRKIAHLGCDREDFFNWLDPDLDVRADWAARLVASFGKFVESLPPEKKPWFAWFPKVIGNTTRPSGVTTTDTHIRVVSTSSTGGIVTLVDESPMSPWFPSWGNHER